MTATAPSFVQAIQECQLLKPEQMKEIQGKPEARSPDPQPLARLLVQRGWLTPFQVNQLLAGKGRELVLGPYQLVDQLGQGGMGVVYKARHVRMDRLVALKVIAKHRLAGAKAIQRFFLEARAAAQLTHPNIVTAYDADQEGEVQFLAMEFVEGSDLAKLVKQNGPLPIPQACDFIRQAALGLQHAHEKGIVHRDIKPGNLLVTRPNPNGSALLKILDFGLARIETDTERKTRLTQVNTVLGTVDYMAPEQAECASTVDIRADIYSLGCTLFFLLTARPPFGGSDPIGRMMARLMEPPPPLRTLRTDAPPALEQVVLKMLARKPAERYQTPAELAVALDPFVSATTKLTTTTKLTATQRQAASPPKVISLRGSRTSSKSRVVVAGVAAVLFLGTGLAAVLMVANQEPSKNRSGEQVAAGTTRQPESQTKGDSTSSPVPKNKTSPEPSKKSGPETKVEPKVEPKPVPTPEPKTIPTDEEVKRLQLLRDGLKKSRTDKERVDHLTALGQLGPIASSATPEIVPLLKHPNDFVRAASAEALCKIRPQPEQAVPGLIAALKDANVYVRLHSATALGNIGLQAKAALSALRETTKDRNAAVAKVAREAIQKIGVDPAPDG